MKIKALNLYKKNPTKDTVSVIGVPFEEGSDASGLCNAPAYLRKCGIIKLLEQSGINTVDCGDITLKKSKSLDKLVLKKSAIHMAEVVSKKVEDELNSGRRVLTLGGDHGISLGTITGASLAKGKDIGVIWIDAHPDLSTWEESISKNIHGMQAAALMGFGDKDLVNVGGSCQKLKTQNILYIGLKDMDPHEIKFIEKHKINVITMFDILNTGIGGALEVVSKFIKNHKNIWVSLDMDAIQKKYVPSSPMATDEGLSLREISALVRFVGREGNVMGVDIVEMSAKGDIDNKTADLAIDLASKLFGSDAGWYERYMGEYK